MPTEPELEEELRRASFPPPQQSDLSEAKLHYGTAVHEAGHAVIGHVLKLGCGSATIRADADSAGHSIIDDPWIILGKWWGNGPGEGVRPHGSFDSVLRGRILAFMAGWAAEIEIRGECRGGDGDDRRQIALMMESLTIPGHQEDGDGSWERYEARLRARARGLVRRHREKIERVADALVARDTLTAEQIDAVMCGVELALP
jgi:hypothetical protein